MDQFPVPATRIIIKKQKQNRTAALLHV